MTSWRDIKIAPPAFDVLDFWFGVANNLNDIDVVQALNKKWFMGGREYDAQIKDKFSTVTRAALDGELSDWQSTTAGCLALIIVLDQFPRNLYRGSGGAFAGDRLALPLAQRVIASPELDLLHPHEQIFMAMPFQHAEDLEDQKRSVDIFSVLVPKAPTGHEKMFENTLNYARIHYEIIEQFGRFPHRNKALERASTEAELAYMAGDAHTFGQ